MRGFLQVSPTDINKNIDTRHLCFHGVNTFHLDHLRASEIKELIRSDALHDILANVVKQLTHFLQISPSDVNKKFATTYFFIWGINTFHMDHLRASEAKEWIRSDALHGISDNLVK